MEGEGAREAEKVWISLYLDRSHQLGGGEGGAHGRDVSVKNSMIPLRKKKKENPEQVRAAKKENTVGCAGEAGAGEGGGIGDSSHAPTLPPCKSTRGRHPYGKPPRRTPPPVPPATQQLENAIMYLQALRSAIWAKGDAVSVEKAQQDERELRVSNAKVQALQRICEEQQAQRAELTLLEANVARESDRATSLSAANDESEAQVRERARQVAAARAGLEDAERAHSLALGAAAKAKDEWRRFSPGYELENAIMYLQALRSAIWAKGDAVSAEKAQQDERELRECLEQVTCILLSYDMYPPPHMTRVP
jgi:hypothetical protein